VFVEGDVVKFTIDDLAKNLNFGHSAGLIKSHIETINKMQTENDLLAESMKEGKQTLICLLEEDFPNYHMAFHICRKLRAAQDIFIETQSMIKLMKNPHPIHTDI
jgi:hypothetical protein